MRPIIFEACFHSRGSPRAQFEGPDPHRTLGARWFGDQPVRVRRFGLLEVFNPFNSKNWMVNTSTLRKILLPRLSMLQNLPIPGSLRVPSFRPRQLSGGTAWRERFRGVWGTCRMLPKMWRALRRKFPASRSWEGTYPTHPIPRASPLGGCMVLKETKKWKMVR